MMESDNVRVVPGEEVSQQTIAVVTLGLEERSRQVFANALQKNAKGQCVLTDAHQAQIALLDTDSSDAKDLLKQFQQSYPTTPLIGLGKQQTDLSLHAFIFKPLNLAQLMGMIVELANPELKQVKNMITEDKIAKAMLALENKSIAKSLHKRAEQNQAKSAAKRAMPSKSDEMCFDPERFLLGTMLEHISQSATRQETVVLTCLSDRTIIIDPAHGKISSNLSDNQIRTLSIAPMDDSLSSPISAQVYNNGEVNSDLDFALKLKDLRHFSQETFMWNLGLMTCRGRIPAEFTVCNRHYLRRWPNLTRANVPANAMRILAYWIQQPCSLSDIYEQLDVPMQDVFSVFSAAYSAGLTGEAKRRADEMIQAVDLSEHRSRGLMKSIISRLRRDKPKHFSKSA